MQPCKHVFTILFAKWFCEEYAPSWTFVKLVVFAENSVPLPPQSTTCSILFIATSHYTYPSAVSASILTICPCHIAWTVVSIERQSYLFLTTAKETFVCSSLPYSWQQHISSGSVFAWWSTFLFLSYSLGGILLWRLCGWWRTRTPGD